MGNKFQNICKSVITLGFAAALCYSCSGNTKEQKVERPFPIHFGADSILKVTWDFDETRFFYKYLFFPKEDSVLQRRESRLLDENNLHLEVMYNNWDSDSDVNIYDVSLTVNSSLSAKKYAEFRKEGHKELDDIMSKEFQKKINKEYKHIKEGLMRNRSYIDVYLGKWFSDYNSHNVKIEIEQFEDEFKDAYERGDIISVKCFARGDFREPDSWLEISYKDIRDAYPSDISTVDIYTVAICDESGGRKVLTEMCSKRFAYRYPKESKFTHTTSRYAIMDDKIQKEINKEYESLKKADNKI